MASTESAVGDVVQMNQAGSNVTIVGNMNSSAQAAQDSSSGQAPRSSDPYFFMDPDLNQNGTVSLFGQNETVNGTYYFNGTYIIANKTAVAPAASGAVSLTPYELWIQLIFFYGFLCGVVSTICSILIWIGIWRKKSLRTRFFIIVGCLTFCRTWVCVQFLIMAIYRSLRTLKIVDTWQLRIVCHCIHFWLINGWTIEMFLLCTLVLDRVVAIVASNYYRLLTPNSAFQLCVAEYVVFSILKLVPSYLAGDMGAKVECINLYSFLSETFNEYSQYIDLVMVGVIMILYVILIIYVQIRVREMKKHTDKASEAANVALQRQLKLMPILRNLVLMHCGLALSAKLLLTLSSVVPDAYKQRMTAYGGVVSCLDVFANVVQLLFTNAEVRRAALPCWKEGGNKIEPSKLGTTLTVMPKTERTASIKPLIHDHGIDHMNSGKVPIAMVS